MFKEKISLYLLSIVGIVAVVGIVVLLLNGGRVSTEVSEQVSDEDIAGLAISAAKATSVARCTDTDGGFYPQTKGTISGGTWKTTKKTYTAKTDSCGTSGSQAGKILEYYCSDSTHGFYTVKDCATVVGTGYVCEDGTCVLESCGDGYCGFYETHSSCSDDCDEITEFTLADWPDMFIEDDELTALVVIGADAKAEDVIAGTNIITSLVVDGISVGPIYLDSEIDDPYAQDLILVGTQCDNDIINEVLGYDEDTCAESIHDEDTAIIKLLVTETNKILIISGYTAIDTRYAAAFMSEEDYYSTLEGIEAVIDTSDEDSMYITMSTFS